MPSRALLVGSTVDGLAGVENDVAAMAKALGERGFIIDRCSGEDATRAGIIAAYERLIDEAGPGDPVVVYYSGHGGRAQPPATGSPGPDLMDLQFIVPVDYHDSTPDDYRVITSLELSALLTRLTDKTDNVAVVLDCCHATHMSRNDRLQVKAVDPRPYEHLRAHVDRLRAAGSLDIRRLRSTGNPHAVRVVACAPDQSAHEYIGDEGYKVGMFTEALVLVLGQAASTAVTWATVMDRVRERVLDLAIDQRPEVEGPARRVLFDTAEDDLLSSLRVTPLAGGRARLECAPLLGVRKGDEFMVMPPGAAAADAGTRLGDLRVDRVGPLSAEGSVVLANGATEVPVGALAHRTSVAEPALAVRVPETAADLRRAVSATPLIRLADPDEKTLAEVRVDDAGGLTVHDAVGPLHAPRPGDAGGVARVVDDLKILAQVCALRRLIGRSDWALGAKVTVEWGRVVDGRPEPLESSGAVVHSGDKIYISVRNDSESTIYVSLVDIGVAGRVAVLTRQSPAGVQLAPGKIYTYGFDDIRGGLTGLGLTWPDGLDPAHARTETVLVIAASVPQDMSALEQRGMARGAATSPLERILGQIATGGTRDLAADTGSGVRYDVHAIDFELAPLPDEGSFLIDERADPPARHRTARGTRPTTLAVRLEELVVHRNRAMFGADIRVDTVVLTGAGATAQPTYRAYTERFSNIADGEPLPLDRMLIFHGPVVDYLDIAVWVSRDTKGSLALGDMLTEELTGFEVQDALTQLGGALVVPSHAAAAAVLVGAGAVVVNVAYKLLRGAVGNVIGVYRGSLLAGEGYRTGRHPASGSRRVQDFSIAYSVTGVDG